MPSTKQDHIAVDKIKRAIRDIPDFPKPGIIFKDIMPVLKDPILFNQVVDYFYHELKDKKIQYVAGIESRGFILASALAYKLGAGFVPIRKKGKLPGLVEHHDYDLEYGTDTVEVQSDAMEPGTRVALIDDLLATGGTAAASIKLLVELGFLHGRQNLPQRVNTHSMIQF